MKSILITGAGGFIGSRATIFFKGLGYDTYGLGHKGLFSVEPDLYNWRERDISVSAILEFGKDFDAIVHCGGGASIKYSLENTSEDYKKTVEGTLEVLEYMKNYNPNAHLIYPSSPAVQGEHPDQARKEYYDGDPVSPYGKHKKETENLCLRYSKKFGLNISIVRLYSVYGNGLRKQLLWDACNKIMKAKSEVIFWGTGEEVRDFIHVEDVMSLFGILLNRKERFLIINGGTGIRHTVKNVVEKIRSYLKPNIRINFNNQINIGNPKYYLADTHKLKTYKYNVKKDFNDEIKNYADWVKGLND